MMNSYPYNLRPPIGEDGKIGLIVLKADETIEHDARRIFPIDNYALYTTRLRSADKLTEQSLIDLKGGICTAVELLPNACQFNAIGFACTSAASTIGSDSIREEIQSSINCAYISDPLLALKIACQTMQIKKLGVVSPYDEVIANNMRKTLQNLGIETPHFIGFNETKEANVARIDEASIMKAAIELGEKQDIDAVFISCTNLRTLDVIDRIEDAIAKPVLSSNQVMLWHLSQGLPKPVKHNCFGQLFSQNVTVHGAL